MISLAPNQRLEIIGTNIQVRWNAAVEIEIPASSTKTQVQTYQGYETTTSSAARIIVPTSTDTDRLVIGLVVVPLNPTISVTLRRVTVPPALVGQAVPANVVETLDVVSLAANRALVMGANDAGWLIRNTTS